MPALHFPRVTAGPHTGGAPSAGSPRVAVVVPCFNDGTYIGDTLESLADQEPHELVVVDDGSHEEHTLEVLEGLRRDGVRVISQENQGLGPARMTGVRATSAPFVHPLDSDDRLPPGALTVLADALETRPDAGAAWGSYQTFGTSDCFFPTAPSLDPWRVTYLDEIPATTLMRREMIETVGGWDHVGYEDWDFWMKVAEAGIAGVGVDQVTLLYREHASPRLLSSTLTDHDRHFQVLLDRHRPLVAARSSNRRASPSPATLKLIWPLLDRVPRMSYRRKRQLQTLARYYFQRDMCSSCYRGLSERSQTALRARLRPGE
jgi:glycosyltransferase involved in cell wall biosynthesis